MPNCVDARAHDGPQCLHALAADFGKTKPLTMQYEPGTDNCVKWRNVEHAICTGRDQAKIYLAPGTVKTDCSATIFALVVKPRRLILAQILIPGKTPQYWEKNSKDTIRPWSSITGALSPAHLMNQPSARIHRSNSVLEKT